MSEFLKSKLQDRLKFGNLRSLPDYTGKIDFCSNDYLGLATIDFSSNEVENRLFSGTGSRLISGSNQTTLFAEKICSIFFNSESSLIFNSGYDANIGLFSSILDRHSLVIYDEFIHASVRDGIRLGLGKSLHFKHNDSQDLERILEKNKNSFQRIYIAIESLYSMTGDIAPLLKIANLSEKYNVELIVDEAHAGGVFGSEGVGLCDEIIPEKIIFARVFTFGKAFGSHGACVVGSQVLIDFLVNFARSFIYTTALPTDSYQRLAELFGENSREIERKRLKLQKRILFFRAHAKHLKLESDAHSPIQIVLLSKVDLNKTQGELENRNIAIKIIKSPTVPVNFECFRICIHAENSENDILELINAFILK